MKKRDSTIRVEDTPKLICIFVFAWEKSWFSHDAAHMGHLLSLGLRPGSDTNWVVQQAGWKLVISDIHV